MDAPIAAAHADVTEPSSPEDTTQVTAQLGAADDHPGDGSDQAPATDSSVPPPPAPRVDHATAQAAAAVQASAAVAQPTTEVQPEDESDPAPAPRGALHRFGRWASGRPVGPAGAEEPAGADGDAVEPTPEIAGAPATPARGPSSRDRGRLRRRVRYLRRARELGFRDLGGLLFDQYRFRSPNQDLLAAKLAALHALDSERRALEHILGERREFDDLREPGISACPQCGALHASDARFCEVCGTRQTGTPATQGNGVAADSAAPAAEASSATLPEA